MTTMKQAELPKITIEKRIIVQQWNMIGSIGEAVPRPETIPFLQFISDKTGEPFSIDAMTEHLLGNTSRRGVTRKILQFAQERGLLEDKATFPDSDEELFSLRLSENGEEALKKEQVFTPREGNYTISLATPAEQALFHFFDLSLVLDINDSPLDENFKNSTEKCPNNSPPNYVGPLSDFKKIPCLLAPLKRIEEIKIVQNPNPSDSKTWTLSWNLDSGEVSLGFEGKTYNIKTNRPPDDYKLDVLKRLLDFVNTDWTIRGVPVKFDDIQQQERRDFKRFYTIEGARIPIKTSSTDSLEIEIEPLKLSDVTIYPKDAKEEEKWCGWLYEERIDDYLTKTKIDQLIDKLKGKFSDNCLQQGKGIPFRTQLAKNNEQFIRPSQEGDNHKTRKAWYIVAAEDWSL